MRLVIGIAVLAAGVVLLFGQFGVIDVDLGSLLSRWWPLIVVAAGLAMLVNEPRNYAGALIVMGVGAIIQLNILDLVDVNVWGVIWAVVIIAIGVAILRRPGRATVSDDHVNQTAVFFGVDKKVASQNFQGGALTAVMGGIELNMRQAAMPPQQTSELSVFTLMGGIELKVPESWRVEVTGLPVLGGWTVKANPPVDPAAPVLRVRATCVMGGMEIKN